MNNLKKGAHNQQLFLNFQVLKLIRDRMKSTYAFPMSLFAVP